LFDHVMIRVSSLASSGPPLRAALAELGIEPTRSSQSFASWGKFLVAEAGDGHPVTRGLHVAFIAPSLEQVDAFWGAGIEAGLADDGAPGPRPQYGDDYYAAFLRDVDSNSIEAVHHTAAPRRGLLDHLTIRVADLPRSTAFYAIVAAATGLNLHTEPGATALTSDSPGDSLLALSGPPTRGLHVAYPASEGSLRRFHDDATRAGFRSNGAPGPRPQYGPGYLAAFALDPDGNNIELVEHGST
jgi:catechol 2,3-dioxygenase-like lactoylglutathione lyase family enzyme